MAGCRAASLNLRSQPADLESTMDKVQNDTSRVDKGERRLSDSKLDQTTGGIIIIGGAESRFCSNNLATAIPTDQFRAVG
jgi:hypothetical protein